MLPAISFDCDQARYRAYKPDYIFVLGEKRWRSDIFSMDLSANVASPNVSNEGEDRAHCILQMQRRPSASIMNVDYYMTSMCVCVVLSRLWLVAKESTSLFARLLQEDFCGTSLLAEAKTSNMSTLDRAIPQPAFTHLSD